MILGTLVEILDQYILDVVCSAGRCGNIPKKRLENKPRVRSGLRQNSDRRRAGRRGSFFTSFTAYLRPPKSCRTVTSISLN